MKKYPLNFIDQSKEVDYTKEISLKNLRGEKKGGKKSLTYTVISWLGFDRMLEGGLWS